jgi:hypothetical protein
VSPLTHGAVADLTQTSFDNEFFYEDTETQPGAPRDSYCRPESLSNYRNVWTWEGLDRGSSACKFHEIITKSQLEQLKKQLNIGVHVSLSGRIVHIGADNVNNFRIVSAKLDNLLKIRVSRV